MNSKKITVQSFYTVTDEELMLMSSQNPELRFERNVNLANTAVRAPDAAFVAKARLPEGWDQQEDKFINI